VQCGTKRRGFSSTYGMRFRRPVYPSRLNKGRTLDAGLATAGGNGADVLCLGELSPQYGDTGKNEYAFAYSSSA
jgi:hypothetical protein